MLIDSSRAFLMRFTTKCFGTSFGSIKVEYLALGIFFLKRKLMSTNMHLHEHENYLSHSDTEEDYTLVAIFLFEFRSLVTDYFFHCIKSKIFIIMYSIHSFEIFSYVFCLLCIWPPSSY